MAYQEQSGERAEKKVKVEYSPHRHSEFFIYLLDSRVSNKEVVSLSRIANNYNKQLCLLQIEQVKEATPEEEVKMPVDSLLGAFLIRQVGLSKTTFK